MSDKIKEYLFDVSIIGLGTILLFYGKSKKFVSRLLTK